MPKIFMIRPSILVGVPARSRPDLVNIGDSSASDLARAMYHSIHDNCSSCRTG